MYDTEQTVLRVREIDPEAERRWDDFVAACPEATFFHRVGWKRVIEGSLGHETHYLYAEDASGSIVGVLPLVFIRSLLFGRSLSSTAFCVYGGPAAVSASAREALTRRAIEPRRAARRRAYRVPQQAADAERLAAEVLALRDLPQAHRSRSREEPSRHPAQAAGDGPQRHEARPFERDRRQCRPASCALRREREDLGTPVFPNAISRRFNASSETTARC